MADKAISELTAATSVGLLDLFVLEQNNTAKKLTGQILIDDLADALDGHGGIVSIAKTGTSSLTDTYTITYADESTSTYTVSNGKGISTYTQYWAVSSSNSTAPSTWYTALQTMTTTNKYLWSYIHIVFNDGSELDTTAQVIGVYGDTGQNWYVHIRYASQNPTSNSDIGAVPDKWIGVYSGTSSTAPTNYTAYTWYQWKGATGDRGAGITAITKTGTSGVQDTYTVYYGDNQTTTFTVTNGSNISSITKTSTSGLQDTYTVTLTDGSTTTFTVTNAKSITSVTMVSGNHAAGSTDTYQILFNDGDTAFFTVYNGANGTGAVSTVSGIQAVDGDVPLLLTGNSAPTTSTVGQENQFYFDYTHSILYVCLGETNGTYSWAGAGVTVDSAMSTSSTNPVQNKVISTKVGTAALTTTAQDCSGAINEHETDIGGINTKIGTTALPTTAQTLTGAIAEHESDISGINTNVSNLQGDVSTLVRPNLLDNWYFEGGGSQQGGGQFPINQRAQTHYGGDTSITIDRWHLQYDTYISLSSGYLELSGKWGCWQNFPCPLPAGEYTASILYDSLVGSLWIYEEPLGGGTSTAQNHTSDSSGILSVTGTSNGSNIQRVSLELKDPNGNSSVRIYAIKLELGDTQTLAHQENGTWVLNEIPNYSEQLLRCQRYYWKNQNSNIGSLGYSAYQTDKLMIPLQAPQMIGTPTISGTVQEIGGNYATSLSVDSGTAGGYLAVATFASNLFTLNQAYLAKCDIELSTE